MIHNLIYYINITWNITAKVDRGRGRSASNADAATYTPPICSSQVSSVPSLSSFSFLLLTRASPAQFTARSPTDLGQMTPDYCIWVECRLQRLRWKRTSLYPGRPSLLYSMLY